MVGMGQGQNRARGMRQSQSVAGAVDSPGINSEGDLNLLDELGGLEQGQGLELVDNLD